MTASLLTLRTAGVSVLVADRTRHHADPLARAAGVGPGTESPTGPDAEAHVRVVVEPDRRPFDTTAMRPLTRGAWSGGGGVVLDNVGGSGFSQAWRVVADREVEVRTRWLPGPLEQGARLARSRFHALRSQVLLHYPALWTAGLAGLVPLHVSVLELDGVTVLLAGPGGVGKSTLVAGALAEGARVTCDNLAASDGTTAHGVREPLRLDTPVDTLPAGARTTHGRREHLWTGASASAAPDLVVVVRRGSRPEVRTLTPAEACRTLVAGTYAAGELKRFWPLTATLGLGTGRGSVHPGVEDVARRICAERRCLELRLGPTPGPGLSDLLGDELARARATGVSR